MPRSILPITASPSIELSTPSGGSCSSVSQCLTVGREVGFRPAPERAPTFGDAPPFLSPTRRSTLSTGSYVRRVYKNLVSSFASSAFLPLRNLSLRACLPLVRA
jgi:hypothetical protein